MSKPTRYLVEWQICERSKPECRDVPSLRAAKRLAREMSGAVWERPNIRARVTDDGITLYDWDAERVVYMP